jgi:hypothetical protein
MSEEVTDEQSEAAEEKSLDEQIALLEGIATVLEEEAEVKSDDPEEEVKGGDDAEENDDGEADHSEKECKDMENCPWHGVDAKEAEESDSEEKSVVSDGDDEKSAGDHERVHPVATGYPYDAVVLQPGDPEFDEEEDEKNEMVVPKKRRIVVVEMDPSQVTEDMKAYEVEVDEDEEEQPYPEDEDAKRHAKRPQPEADERERPRMVAPPPSPTPPAPLNEAPTPDRLPPPPPAGDVPAANPRLARLLAMAAEQNENSPEEEEEERNAARLPKAVLVRKEDDVEETDAGVSPENTLMDPMGLTKRLKRLGMTSEEIKSFGGDDFMCGVERKVRSGDVCNFCRGGCASEKGLPSLLEVEVAAEAEYKGEIIDSGYAPKDDIFVLDLKTDDGFLEAYYAGNGSPLGWIRLDENAAIKSAEEESVEVVSFDQAEQLALKHIKGKSLGVDVDIFQGEDAYVIEIDGIDGKSYDAYVGVTGQFLGSDMIDFTDDEEDEIKALRVEKRALESELHLKRNYASADVAQMAEDGVALKDGSYPILTSEDLAHAVHISYRVKTDELRFHIEQRAYDLDRMDLLPSEWVEEEKSALEADFVSSMMEMEMLEAELPSEGSDSDG